MYWLLGGSPRTIPGFIVGALLAGGIIVAIEPSWWIGALFGGLVGETMHHYFLKRRGK
jgi:hypothetical protein